MSTVSNNLRESQGGFVASLLLQRWMVIAKRHTPTITADTASEPIITSRRILSRWLLWSDAWLLPPLGLLIPPIIVHTESCM